MMIDEIWIAV